MATQLKHTDFQPAPYPAARPKLRVVFDTTSATSAVAAALADLPPAVREATLDELEIASSAEALIASARHLLSPHVYAEFLCWGLAAVRLTENYGSDDENDARCGRTMHAVREVFRAIPITFEDFAFKTWIAGLEAGDCSCVGPLIAQDSFGTGIRDGVASIAADIASLSAIVPPLDRFASTGWSLAGQFTSWPTSLVEPVVAAFETAQQIAADLSQPASFVPRHAERAASPAPGSALFDWNATCRAYNVAVEISAATDGETDPDNLAGAAESHALHRLMLTPAPSMTALAMKSRVYEATECWELNAASDIARVFTSDVERFAKVSRSIEPFEPGSEDDWADAERELASLGEQLRVRGLSDEQVETLTDQETQAYNRLLALPARSTAQVIGKLQAMTVFHTHVPASELAGALVELKRFLPTTSTRAPADEHRGWFKARNGLNDWLNGDAGPNTDDTMSDGCGMLNQYDNRILQTPATTVDGLLTQLVLAAQLQAEGHDIGNVESGKLVASAQRLAGLGSVEGFIEPVEQAA